MRRKIVNHHKLIKSFDRTADKTERFFDKLFKKNGPRKKKDFTWKGTQYNPFTKVDHSEKRKLILELIVLTISIMAVIYLIVFSGLFNIIHIMISGNNKITAAEIKAVVKNTLEFKSYGCIPNSSFFVADVTDIKEVLKKRFPIDEIKIEKQFPHDLNITLTEKISTIVYDNGTVYGLIGLDGSVIELIRSVEDSEWKDVIGKGVTTTADGTTSTIDMVTERMHTPDTSKLTEQTGEYPLIYDKREHQTDKGLTVLTPEEVKLMIDWHNEIKNETYGVAVFTIENDMDFSIQTKEGWIIKSRFARKNAVDQLRELKLALQKIENTKKLSYIDVRYENRIYWK
jgi:cell division septal protein FtsQ